MGTLFQSAETGEFRTGRDHAEAIRCRIRGDNIVSARSKTADAFALDGYRRLGICVYPGWQAGDCSLESVSCSETPFPCWKTGPGDSCGFYGTPPGDTGGTRNNPAGYFSGTLLSAGSGCRTLERDLCKPDSGWRDHSAGTLPRREDYGFKSCSGSRLERRFRDRVGDGRASCSCRSAGCRSGNRSADRNGQEREKDHSVCPDQSSACAWESFRFPET